MVLNVFSLHLQLSSRPFFNSAEILSVMPVPGPYFLGGLSAKDVPES